MKGGGGKGGGGGAGWKVLFRSLFVPRLELKEVLPEPGEILRVQLFSCTFMNTYLFNCMHCPLKFRHLHADFRGLNEF